VRSAKRFETAAGAVEVFKRQFSRRCVEGLHCLGSLHSLEPQGDYRCGNQPAQQAQTSWRLNQRALKFLDYSSFDETKVMHYFANTPFPLRGSLGIDARLERRDRVD